MEWRLEAAMVGNDGFPAVIVRLARSFFFNGMVPRGASRSVGVSPTSALF